MQWIEAKRAGAGPSICSKLAQRRWALLFVPLERVAISPGETALVGPAGLVGMDWVKYHPVAESFAEGQGPVWRLFFDTSSPLYLFRQMGAVTLNVLFAQGFLAMVAIAALWCRFPVDACKALSDSISRLWSRDGDNGRPRQSVSDVSKLVARLAIGTATIVTAASVVAVITVDVGPELNGAAREIPSSLDSIRASTDLIRASADSNRGFAERALGEQRIWLEGQIDSVISSHVWAIDDLRTAVVKVAEGQI